MTTLNVADIRLDNHADKWANAYYDAIRLARSRYPDLVLEIVLDIEEPDPSKALLSTVLISARRHRHQEIPPHLEAAIGLQLTAGMHLLFVALTGSRIPQSAVGNMTTRLRASGFQQIPRRRVVAACKPKDLGDQVFEAISEIAIHLSSVASTMTQVEDAATSDALGPQSSSLIARGPL